MDHILIKMKEIMAELLEDEEIQQKISEIARTKNCQQTANEELIQQMKILREEKEQLEEEKGNLEQKAKQLEEEKGNLEQKAKQLEEEKGSLEHKADQLEEETGTLKEEKEQLEKENKGLEIKKTEAENNSRQLSSQLETKNEEISRYKARQSEVQNSYDSLLKKAEPVEEAAEIWQELMGAGEENLAFLDRLAGGRNLLAYIALGSDFSRIRQLWDYIRETAQRDERNEQVLRGLSHYFDMCINIYNTVNNRRERLEKLPVVQGSAFDSEINIKTAKSLLNGCVSEILLNGYRNQDGKVVFQAVVRAE